MTREQTIRLGNLLVEQLEQEPATDMTCRWMAHYIAELIGEAEAATGRQKALAQERCFRAILDLWTRSASLPSGHQPLENFTPILATLEALNPDEPQGFYLSKIRRRIQGPQEAGSAGTMVEIAQALDSAARVLIEFILKEASESAADDRTRAFVALAAQLPGKKANRVSVVRRLLQRADALDLEHHSDSAEKRIRDRIAKLQAFASTCAAVESALSKNLENKEAEPTSNRAVPPTKPLRKSRKRR